MILNGLNFSGAKGLACISLSLIDEADGSVVETAGMAVTPRYKPVSSPIADVSSSMDASKTDCEPLREKSVSNIGEVGACETLREKSVGEIGASELQIDDPYDSESSMTTLKSDNIDLSTNNSPMHDVGSCGVCQSLDSVEKCMQSKNLEKLVQVPYRKKTMKGKVTSARILITLHNLFIGKRIRVLQSEELYRKACLTFLINVKHFF